MHFGGEESLPAFMQAVREIADASVMEAGNVVRTEGNWYETEQYLTGQVRRTGEAVRLFGGTAQSSSLFGRALDHILVPYWQAVAAEGYRLSPDRLAERFRLSDEQREVICQKLLPKVNVDRSSVPLMTKKELYEAIKT